jgi:hypothetical protein
MPKISQLFCFAAYDKDEDDEGVPTFQSKLGPIPLMGADVTRVEQFMPIAQQIADATGKQIRIYKFSHKEQIGEVSPRSKATSKSAH